MLLLFGAGLYYYSHVRALRESTIKRSSTILAARDAKRTGRAHLGDQYIVNFALQIDIIGPQNGQNFLALRAKSDQHVMQV